MGTDKKAAKAVEPQPQIVSAVGTAVHSEVPGLAEALETAMSKAVIEAMADGVSLDNSDELLKRKTDARERVLNEWHG